MIRVINKAEGMNKFRNTNNENDVVKSTSILAKATISLAIIPRNGKIKGKQNSETN